MTRPQRKGNEGDLGEEELLIHQHHQSLDPLEMTSPTINSNAISALDPSGIVSI